MKTKWLTKPDAEIPTNYDELRSWIEAQLAADVEYGRVLTRDRAMRTRLAELETRRNELLAGAERRVHHDDLTRRAQTTIEDGVVPRPDARDQTRRQDLAAVDDERHVLTRALELHREPVARERARLGGTICQKLSPRHRSLVQEIAARLRELDAVLTEHADLFLALRDAEVANASGYLRPMHLHRLGLLRDEQSPVAAWLHEARAYGLLDDSGENS